MASIWQVSELPPDLLGDRARGVSAEKIPWELYKEIVRRCTKKFGPSLKRATSPLLVELINKTNRTIGSKMSLVFKRSLLATVLVNEIRRTEVSVTLFFADLKEGPSIVMDRFFRELAERARFVPTLEVRNGRLVGSVELPPNVVFLPDPEERAGSQWTDWLRPGQDISAEMQFLQKARLPIVR